MGHGHHHHGHGHPHDHPHDHHGHDHKPGGSITRVLAIALALTGLFAVIEFAAGFLTGSLALLADAWHMVSDLGSLALALVATLLARRPRSPRRTFGYRRIEVLAALANGVLLGVAAVLVVIEAIERLQTPQSVEGLGVVGVGIAGLTVNLVNAALLHRSGGSNVNVRAALAHVLGDALGSCAAIVAGLVVVFTGDTRADPLLSLAVAALLIWGAQRLVRETGHILLEGTPEGLDAQELERAIAGVPGVASVHDLHVWSITSGEPALMAHVVLAPGGWHGDQVARAVCDTLSRRYGLEHTTIQPEPPPAGIVQLGTPPRDGAQK